jgi:hypothetical protein
VRFTATFFTVLLTPNVTSAVSSQFDLIITMCLLVAFTEHNVILNMPPCSLASTLPMQAVATHRVAVPETDAMTIVARASEHQILSLGPTRCTFLNGAFILVLKVKVTQ